MQNARSNLVDFGDADADISASVIRLDGAETPVPAEPTDGTDATMEEEAKLLPPLRSLFCELRDKQGELHHAKHRLDHKD